MSASAPAATEGLVAARPGETRSPVHVRAVLGMVGVCFLWSIAGVVTRGLSAAPPFEVTFWRSAFCAMALGVYMAWCHGRATPALLRQGGRALWLSGLMWSVMFTCFMMALTLTSVANVLITMSLAPLMTALMARFALGQRVPVRTWVAMAVAGAAVAWMYSRGLSSEPRHLWGTAVALAVPLAAAVNWTTLQRSGRHVDLVPALLIAGVLSALATLPLALPLQASAHDLSLLALLGVFQLAVPCVLAVRIARHLAAPEISLLALLEVVFGIALAWWGAGEAPSPELLQGGVLVVTTLAANEFLALRPARSPAKGPVPR